MALGYKESTFTPIRLGMKNVIMQIGLRLYRRIITSRYSQSKRMMADLGVGRTK